MFSQVDISVAPQWQGIRDSKRLSQSVLLCPTFFLSILMGSSLKRDLHSRIPTRAERGREKNPKKTTQTHSDVRQPATARHTPARMCRSQSSDSIHQARQREREHEGGERKNGGVNRG